LYYKERVAVNKDFLVEAITGRYGNTLGADNASYGNRDLSSPSLGCQINPSGDPPRIP